MTNNPKPGLSEETLHEQLTDSSKSAFSRYQDLALGSNSIWYLIKYELIMLFTSWVPGALGLVLRKALYPSILGKVGGNVVFGQGVVIRHGQKITIGDGVIIDDSAVLDAKGSSNTGWNEHPHSRDGGQQCCDGGLRVDRGFLLFYW